MNIGEVIKDRRQKRKMTQTELAELLKVTPQAVSRWEMNVSYPDIAMIPLISEVLCVSADELLGIRQSCEGEETSGELWVKVDELQQQMTGIKPSVPDPLLNQSQIDSVFDYVPAPATGESKKVLIVDDADFMRMMLRDILTHHGHTVLEAKNGQECLNILQDEGVDVCVLDIRMPGIDGMEVLKRIKEDQPGLIVVMLSALCSESTVKTALQLGADAFVAKPFQAECLVSRINLTLQSKC